MINTLKLPKMKTKVIQITILLFLASVTLTSGAENPKDTLNEEGKTASNPILKKQDLASKVKIVDAYHFSMHKKQVNAFAIGYENYFKIENFQSFKTQILDSLASAEIDLVLFVNGNPFPETKMTMSDESNRTISFFWSRNSDATKAFSRFYTTQWSCTVHSPRIGFGYCDPQTKIWKQLSDLKIKKIEVVKKSAISVTSILIIILILLFFSWGINKNMLRSGNDDKSPYSLSSTQMAFWIVIIFSSFTYLLIINRELANVPNSTLILLGITTLTAVGSKGVPLMNNGGSSDRKYHVAQASKVSGTINRFMIDLISEGESGVSIHRVQMLLFTFLFGIYYAFQVFKQQMLPDFTPEQLSLIGVSSGSFVLLKSVMDKSAKVQEDKNKTIPDGENVISEFNDAKTKMEETVKKASDFISKNIASKK